MKNMMLLKDLMDTIDWQGPIKFFDLDCNQFVDKAAITAVVKSISVDCTNDRIEYIFKFTSKVKNNEN